VGERFVLTNSRGERRAVLTVDEQDNPLLALYAPGERADIALGFQGGAIPVLVMRKDGRPRIGLTLQSDGTPAVVLYDAAGGARIVLDIDAGDDDGRIFVNGNLVFAPTQTEP